MGIVSSSEPSYPDARRAWYAVGVFVIAYTFSYIDRTILTLMVGPIRASLGITDTELSLLHGLAFAVFYTLLGIPIGRLADRAHRVWIIAIGIAVWSVMTAACGLARNFTQMFLARIGVGVGEAALSPAVYSLLGDYFPPAKLGQALSVYTSAVYVGAGLALVAGGAVISAVPPLTLPLIGAVEPWQLVFFAVGLPGALVAALALTVREVPRTKLLPQSGAAMPFSAIKAHIAGNGATYGRLVGGYTALALLWNGVTAWVPTLFIRTFQWTPAMAGTRFGLALIVVGGLGVVLGGWLSARLQRRGRSDANILVGVWASIGATPFAIIAPLMPDPALALAGVVAVVLFASLPFGCAAAAFQDITPNQMRAQVTAMYFFVLNLAGIGLGPTLVAVMTDYVFGRDTALPYAMACAASLAGPLAIALLASALRPYRESLARRSF